MYSWVKRKYSVIKKGKEKRFYFKKNAIKYRDKNGGCFVEEIYIK
jgi:hypothetical protein